VTARKRAGKRGNGEGSVYQRAGDGRWVAMIDLGYGEGRRRRRYFYGRTRAEAARKLRAALDARDTGQLIAAGSCTVTEWFTTYMRDVAKPRVRPLTYERYARDVRLHIEPAIGRVRLDKLQPAHLVALYNAKRAAGLSPNSIRHLHAVIRRALAVAVRWRLVAVNVATLVDSPTVPHHEVVPLSVAEAHRFLAAARGDRMAARWAVGLALGLRQGETLGLQWDDVDLENGFVRVRRTLQRHAGAGLVFTEPKTPRSRRVVALPSQLMAALSEHREQQGKEREIAAELWTETGCVFTTSVGGPVDPSNDYRAFRHLLNAAGLRPVRLHDLRHTAASLLLAQNVPARVVMEVLGHSQISLTMNTYTHVAPQLSREAANRMGDALWGEADR